MGVFLSVFSTVNKLILKSQCKLIQNRIVEKMKVHKQNMQILKRRRQNLNASRSIMNTKVCLVIKVTIITGCIPFSEAKLWIYGFKNAKRRLRPL